MNQSEAAEMIRLGRSRARELTDIEAFELGLVAGGLEQGHPVDHDMLERVRATMKRLKAGPEERPWKPGEGMPILTLYAWVATESDGGEGLVAAYMGDRLTPLIGADRARIESYRPLAEITAQQTGCRVALKMFSGGVVLDTI